MRADVEAGAAPPRRIEAEVGPVVCEEVRPPLSLIADLRHHRTDDTTHAETELRRLRGLHLVIQQEGLGLAGGSRQAADHTGVGRQIAVVPRNLTGLRR